jgi:sugar phosphate isomerase/epimerase
MKTGSLAIAGSIMPGSRLMQNSAGHTQLQLHVFSKHLQFLDYMEMAEAAADLGFDGVDLTVRPGGHVEPDRAEDDLPRAVEAIRHFGLKAELMASGINNIQDEVNRKVLEVASKEEIKFYRLAYYNFDQERTIPESLQLHNKTAVDLADYSAQLGIAGTYQNHAGTRVGGEIWDIWHLLQDIDVQWLGCQYDIRHAIVEGGTSWTNGLRLIRDKINTLVLKDFIWERTSAGWKIKNVPLGQGMVDFPAYFKLLKSYGISVPVSMHFEYDLGGAEHGSRDLDAESRKTLFAAMRRDLQMARKWWNEA